MFNYRIKWQPASSKGEFPNIRSLLSNDPHFNGSDLLRDKITPVFPNQVDDRNRAKQIIGRVELGSKSNSGLSRHLILSNRPSNNEQQSNNVNRLNNVMVCLEYILYNK